MHLHDGPTGQKLRDWRNALANPPKRIPNKLRMRGCPNQRVFKDTQFKLRYGLCD